MSELGGQLLDVERTAQLIARGDSELGEQPIKVKTDGAVREKEALPDVAVGHSGGDHLGDLKLLGREPIGSSRQTFGTALARGAQLPACAFDQRGGPHRLECVPSGAHDSAMRRWRRSHKPYASWLRATMRGRVVSSVIAAWNNPSASASEATSARANLKPISSTGDRDCAATGSSVAITSRASCSWPL